MQIICVCLTTDTALQPAASGPATSACSSFWRSWVGQKLTAHTIHSLSPDSNIFVSFNLEQSFETLEIPDVPANISLKNLDVAPPQAQDQILDLLLTNPELRLISSSIMSVEQLKAHGISEKLLTALNPVEIGIPSLAQRKKDLPDLFESLVHQTVRVLNTDMPQIPQSIYAQVMAKNWAGNLPALRNFATTIAVGLNVHHRKDDNLTLTQQMDIFERLVLSETLKRNNGKAVDAALALGLPRKTFYDRLARYDLQPKDFKTP